ncbi:MAG: PepSY domain-containing protein [Cyanobacteria bacterium CRU_2_1]|nr:PepSY domain-containing protein [Cyanobacteria bacterium RU_5_0]NJR60943.1 PepSY domain-containing protein [Cyanobacteria bacterium CRU_2_1]
MRNVPPLINAPSTAESPVNRFYRTVWRWHFYAGLFVIPFMLILAITGIIYLFKPQLDTVMYPDRLFVQPTGTLLPYTQQLEAVQTAYPEATVAKFIPNIAPDRSSEVELKLADDQTLTAFVNPYTAQVLGDRDEDNNLQAIVRKIHGELMIGKTGDYLVELAACWGLVLLITGLYLWLPRNGFTLWGTFIPRLRSGRRIFWRDLHAVPGFYGIVLVAFLILTGLPWSGFWGETFVQVWNRFPAPMWNDVPQSTVLTGSLNQQGTQTVPWAVERLPMPQSDASEHQHQHNPELSSGDRETIPPSTPVNLDSIIALAQAKNAPPGFSVSFPEGETGVYTISAFPDDPTQEVTMHMDQYSGTVLADVRWQDYGWLPKTVEMGIAIHMGKYFGIGNQLLMLLACLIVILLSVSGAVMWWRRRPANRLGAPALPEYVQSWKVPMAIVAVLGIAFPLVGFSLLAVLLLDYFVLSRIPSLKRTLN